MHPSIAACHFACCNQFADLYCFDTGSNGSKNTIGRWRHRGDVQWPRRLRRQQLSRQRYSKAVTRIWQNEYTIWAAHDKHARAYNMLSNPVSMRMGKILKLGSNPNQAEKCLVCHSLDVASNLRAQSFQTDEGVSCENCHGPAMGWFGPHTTKGWTHEQSLKLGMYDTRDLAARSEKCMSCHVGTSREASRSPNDRGGHPDLTFALNTFSASMPRHWKFPDANLNQNAWEGVREWAIGQGVELRETLNRLSRSASNPKTWPEFAELECFACHHSLTQPKDSWRQAAGYAGTHARRSRLECFALYRVSRLGEADKSRHRQATRHRS